MGHYHNLSAGSPDDKIEITTVVKVVKPVAKRAAKCAMIIGTGLALRSLVKLARDSDRRAQMVIRAKFASDAVAEFKKQGIQPQGPKKFQDFAYKLLWVFMYLVADQLKNYYK